MTLRYGTQTKAINLHRSDRMGWNVLKEIAPALCDYGEAVYLTLLTEQNKILIEVAGRPDRYIHANPEIWAPAIARTKARRARYRSYCYESPDDAIVTTDATNKEN